MQDNLPFRRDESLRDVEGCASSLRVSKHDKHTSFLDGFSDSSHFRRIFLLRVVHVFVDKFDIFENAGSPDTPVFHH